MQEVKHYKVKILPSTPYPNSVYYVKATTQSEVKTYITDQFGQPFPLIDLNSGSGGGSVNSVTGTGVTGTSVNPIVNINTFLSTQLGNLLVLSSTDSKLFVKPITSPNQTIDIVATTSALELELSQALQDLINSAIQSGDNISALNNDAGYITAAQVPAGVFLNDIPVVLSNGKTLGKYTSGQTIPAINKTFEEVLKDIALEFVQPVFTSFSITAQSTTVEVGTTLSGSKTFTWGITQNSATVPTVDIYNNTLTATLLAATNNDGTQAITITSALLGTDGATQSWKAIGNTTAPGNVITSTNFVVTAKYYRFYKTAITGTAPTNSAGVRTGSTSTFDNTFPISISIGNQFAFFAYPKFRADGTTQKGDITNDSVKYEEGFNSSVGDSFTKTEVQVLDANGTSTWYKVYTVNLPSPYEGVATYNVTIPT